MRQPLENEDRAERWEKRSPHTSLGPRIQQYLDQPRTSRGVAAGSHTHAHTHTPTPPPPLHLSLLLSLLESVALPHHTPPVTEDTVRPGGGLTRQAGQRAAHCETSGSWGGGEWTEGREGRTTGHTEGRRGRTGRRRGGPERASHQPWGGLTGLHLCDALPSGDGPQLLPECGLPPIPVSHRTKQKEGL